MALPFGKLSLVLCLKWPYKELKRPGFSLTEVFSGENMVRGERLSIALGSFSSCS